MNSRLLRIFTSRFFAKPDTGHDKPTATIYFAACMNDLIGEIGDNDVPIWRIAPDAFYIHGDSPKALILRRFGNSVVTALSRLPSAKLYYLLDDDVAAGAKDPHLAAGYRNRLKTMAEDILPDVLSKANKLYVTSPRLLKVFEHYKPTLVDPSIIMPLADLSHHTENAPLKIVFSGTGSHRADLNLIKVELIKYLRTNPEVQFDHFLGDVKGFDLPNVVQHNSMTWPAFNQFMRENKYHIAILPNINSRFNAARSVTKLYEFAYFGAAPILSNCVSFSALAQDSALLCPDDDHHAWHDKLDYLSNNRQAMHALAYANIELVRRLGDKQSRRNFWISELEIHSKYLNTAEQNTSQISRNKKTELFNISGV